MKYTLICVSQHGEEEIIDIGLSIDEAIGQLRELLAEEEEGESYLVRESSNEDEDSEDEDDENDEDDEED